MTEGEQEILGGARATALIVAGIVGSIMATSFMVTQTLGEPFGDGGRSMSSDQHVSFWAGAVLLVGIQVVILVVAYRFQSTPVGVIGFLALLAAIAMTAMLYSPFLEPAPSAWDGPGDDYVPCYSGSGDCPGG